MIKMTIIGIYIYMYHYYCCYYYYYYYYYYIIVIITINDYYYMYDDAMLLYILSFLHAMGVLRIPSPTTCSVLVANQLASSCSQVPEQVRTNI